MKRRDPIWEDDSDLKAEAAREKAPGGRPNGHARRRVELVPFNQMQPNLTEADLVAGMLGSDQVSEIFGPSGCGKTFLALDIGLRVATGKKWFRRRVEHGTVVYLAAEAGRRVFRRVEAWKRQRLRHDDGDGAVPFFVVPQALDLCHSDDDLDELIAVIRETCEDAPLLIIIDTLARVMAGGNENSPEDMGAIIAAADRLREEFAAHVCIIHHVGKDASRGSRGHSSFHCAVDTEIEITRDEEAGLSTARVVKQRDGEMGERIHFRLDVVEIGENAETGEPVTSCVVVAPDAAEVADAEHNRASAGMTKAEKTALNALRRVLEDAGEKPPASAKCPADRWVREEAWRTRCYREGISSGEPRARRAAFRRAMEGLLDAELIGSAEGFVWLQG